MHLRGMRRQPRSSRGAVFQSTHPLRDATIDPIYKVLTGDEFQSTHPLRDATLFMDSSPT